MVVVLEFGERQLQRGCVSAALECAEAGLAAEPLVAGCGWSAHQPFYFFIDS